MTTHSTTTEAAPEPCRWCAEGDKPKFLDADGTLVSVTGNDGVMCHAYEEYWWPCLKFGVEIRCARIPAPSVAPVVDQLRNELSFLFGAHHAKLDHLSPAVECTESECVTIRKLLYDTASPVAPQQSDTVAVAEEWFRRANASVPAAEVEALAALIASRLLTGGNSS